MLLLPIRGADGEVLAIVSVDNPRSGRRPIESELTVLMAVADHAGLALERAQRERAEATALREQSAELRLAAVMLLAETLDLRDPGTGRHSRTVGELARRTAIAARPRRRARRSHSCRGGAARPRQARHRRRGALQARTAGRPRVARDEAPPGDRRADPRARRACGHRAMGAIPSRARGRARVSRCSDPVPDPAGGQDPRCRRRL